LVGVVSTILPARYRLNVIIWGIAVPSTGLVLLSAIIGRYGAIESATFC
jgi:hypothetical protein